MSTESGIPVTWILVSGCTANFEPLQLPNFLSNQCDFWYVAYFYIFVQPYFFSQIVKLFAFGDLANNLDQERKQEN